MNYNVISTGSQGNAVILNDCILIDCGVSFKALKDIYRQIKLVLLTHRHGDHFNKTTIRRLAEERPTLLWGCCEWLVQDLIDCGVSKRNICVFEIGKIYDYTAFKISPVKLYHDVPNCGYRVLASGEKAIYCTDTSTLNGITAKNYDLYMLEANFEADEIRERIREKQELGEFAYEIGAMKRHLSKEECDAFLLDNMGDKSEYVYLHQHRERSSE